jgi:hypothetical protein
MIDHPVVVKLALLVTAAGGAVGCARYVPPPLQANRSNVEVLRTSFGGAAADVAPTTAAPAAEPTGWATLKGTFHLTGQPPARTPLRIDKDQNVCAPGGKPVYSEDLVVDSAGGIKDVVIYLTSPAKFPVGDPKWEHPDYAEKAKATVEFDQKNCVFLSHLFAMRSTQQVKLLNSDPVGHNTNVLTFNQLIPAGGYLTYDPKTETPEPVPVACNVHTWMSAWLVIRNSPYFAVTKEDGSFEIANVPAGVPLEFRVWQEKAKFLQDVSVKGKAEKWSKGRLKLTLQPDEQKTLEVSVDAAAFSR